MNVLTRAIPLEWTRHPFITRLSRYIDLSEADHDSLRRLVEYESTVKKRRDLVVDGYEYRKLCFVEQGFAARYKLLHNGKRQIINIVMPGDVVGLPGSILERATCSVIAITDLKLQTCSMDAYVQLCYRRPQFGLILSWLAVQEAATYAEHLIDTGRRSPIERLARFLLEMHSRLAMVGCAEETSFDLPFSQEVIGDALGLSVPHLNRMLSQLRNEGLVATCGRRVEIVDLDGMKRLGHFVPLSLARIPPYRKGLRELTA
jgi:CRP-like cAMP-binding protein